jgi:drug/metabolite transporter (DMT)-like permease
MESLLIGSILLLRVVLLISIIAPIYFILKKRKDGLVRSKSGIYFLVLGGLFLVGMIFQFINYATYNDEGVRDIEGIVVSIFILFLLSLYLIASGFFLMRRTT